MKFDILTIFPDIFDSYISKGMIRIAQEKKLVKIKAHNLRDFAVDKRGTVDDKPFGGGPGQVLMVEPVVKALKKLKAGPMFLPVDMKSEVKSLKSKVESKVSKSQSVATKSLSTEVAEPKSKVILLSARGKKWNQQLAQEFSNCERLVFVCPRYEGHDERIREFVDEEISIGDFILTGGELGTLVIIDSVTRLIPGVLGEADSLKEESHSTPGYIEYPHYTRPEKFILSNRKGSKDGKDSEKRKSRMKTVMRVPKVLLSGHHAKIEEWRKNHEKIN